MDETAETTGEIVTETIKNPMILLALAGLAAVAVVGSGGYFGYRWLAKRRALKESRRVVHVHLDEAGRVVSIDGKPPTAETMVAAGLVVDNMAPTDADNVTHFGDKKTA